MIMNWLSSSTKNKVQYSDLSPQTRWNRAEAECWYTARQASLAPLPSAWPTSCTPDASGWTRPLTSWSSGARSSRPTWPSWASCCSSRQTCYAGDEEVEEKEERNTWCLCYSAQCFPWTLRDLTDWNLSAVSPANRKKKKYIYIHILRYKVGFCAWWELGALVLNVTSVFHTLQGLSFYQNCSSSLQPLWLFYFLL